MSKLLILCHPKIIILKDNKLDNHWYSQIINDIVEELNIEISSVETVDLLSGGNIQADCFCNEFYELNRNKYDFIISPDAGGPWYKAHEDRDYDKFLSILKGILTMTKVGGYILLDKLYVTEFRMFLNQFFEEEHEIVKVKEKFIFGVSRSAFVLIKKLTE